MNQPPTHTNTLLLATSSSLLFCASCWHSPLAVCTCMPAPAGQRGSRTVLVHLCYLLVDLLFCLALDFAMPAAVWKQEYSDRCLCHSSSARWTPADISSTPTDDRTGHTAPQCPLFVGVCKWWGQAEDQEAALGPSGGPLGRPDDCPPSTLFPQAQWADAA